MADDLVQRLRYAFKHGGFGAFALIGECIDEIECLRAEVAEAKRRASNAEFELAGLEQMRLCDNQYLIDRAEKVERELAALREMIEKAPVAIMDTRDVLGICAPAEEDFPALYAIQGHRVRLVRED